MITNLEIRATIFGFHEKRFGLGLVKFDINEIFD